MSASGLWLSSFLGGKDADKPTPYPGDANIAFYFATDTAKLYVSAKPATGTDADWQEFPQAVLNTDIVSYDTDNKTLVMTDLPTTDPGVAGALYSNSGVVTVSAGA